MMAPKRREPAAAGDGAAPPWKRARAAAAAPVSGGAEPADPPPSSPGKRLRAAARTVLVVLFLIRGKDSGADSFSRIGRVLRAIWSKLERLEERIHALTDKVDKIARSSPTHQNHQRLIQERNQEGTSAGPQGLATAEGVEENSRVRLRFLNDVKSPIYQDNEIKSKTKESIKIGIFDGEKMIKSGPLSKVKIEILALEGDFPYHASDSWTAKEFDQHRANCRDGNGNVLVGEGKTVQLVNGECDLGSIKFREGSSRSHKGMFIIGARVRDGERTGVRIQEAIMKPVVVQVSRNKENEKSYPPKPDHEVHRLEAIAKNGKYRKRLENKSIITVQDFIRALNKDPENLASILQIKKKRKAWEKMTRHASECHLEGTHKLKSYCCMEGNVVLFFNCLHYLVGATFDGYYTVSEKFSPAQQALVDELKKSAYNQIDALPENHVMSNNIPVLIRMDTISAPCASPSIMSRTTQQNSSGRPAGHQVVGVAAVEGLNNAQIEPSCAVANNDPGQSTHNYQDSRLPNQEQFPAVLHNNLYQHPLGHPNSSVRAIEDLLGCENSGYRHLLHPAYSISCVAAGSDQMEIQRQLFWFRNDSFEASTSTGINMTITPQHITISDAAESAQGTMPSQIQAPFPNNGASEASQLLLNQLLHHNNGHSVMETCPDYPHGAA